MTSQTPSQQQFVTWRRRRIPLSYSTHTCGSTSIDRGSYSVAFESHLESRVIRTLSLEPGVLFIRSQPFTLRFGEGDTRLRYTPDLLVICDPLYRPLRRLGFGEWTVIEVKPWARYELHRGTVTARLNAVSHATGLAATCITDRHLDQWGRQP